jgi:taurine dioxygenase
MGASFKFRPPPSPVRQPSEFTRIRVTPRLAAFGAWVDGVDLSEKLETPVSGELRDAWLEYGVLFFRGQKRLTPAQQLALTYVFGSGPDAGNPQIPRSGPEGVVERLIADEKNPSVSDAWHTDFSWKPLGAIGTIIQIQDKPAVGGNTVWRCTRKAYEWLSEPMQQCLERLIAVHSWDNRRFDRFAIAGAGTNSERHQKMSVYPPVEHPVVLTHPLTGRKSLFVNENFTAYIKDVHDAESQILLSMLYTWMGLPEFQINHEWEQNGIAVWDNYRTQHYALSDYYPAYRLNQRVAFRE